MKGTTVEWSQEKPGNPSAMTPYGPDKVWTMLSRQLLAQRNAELGAAITDAYGDESLVLISVLKGSYVFLSDLSREIQRPLSVEFIGISSYGSSTQTSGVVKITQDLSKPIAGLNVLVVEDIVDTGLTMSYLLRNLATRNAASIRVATLLHKPSRAKVEVPMDYVGFVIPDAFVVGYGLDFDEKYRNLPYIGVLDR